MKVDYLVEADNETAHLIYLLLRGRVTWQDKLHGFTNRGVFTSKDKSNPNMISLTYVGIDNLVVCFYWGTSMKVDHQQIEDYLKKEFKGVEEIKSTALVHKLREF